MASPPILNIEQLLAPISEAEPCGGSLKDDPALNPVYYLLRDARSDARNAERDLQKYLQMSDDDRKGQKPPVANWKPVLELATDILAKKSKDLWVAAWLIEGLCREHGFAGLRDGFRLTKELVEKYWDGIHPRPDEDGIATTVAQFAGLNGQEAEGALIAPIDAIPITQGTTSGPYTGSDYRQAAKLDEEPDRRAARLERGVPTLAMISQAAAESEADFVATLRADLEEAIDAFGQLDEVFQTRCGAHAPPTSQIRTALSDCRDRLNSLYRGPDGGAGAAETQESSAGSSPAAGPGIVAKGRVTTREEAFKLLLQVAEFFRRTEPHSPLSYALEQAVRWGKMPLPELLEELISDSTVRDEMFRRTGIPRPPSD